MQTSRTSPPRPRAPVPTPCPVDRANRPSRARSATAARRRQRGIGPAAVAGRGGGVPAMSAGSSGSRNRGRPSTARAWLAGAARRYAGGHAGHASVTNAPASSKRLGDAAAVNRSLREELLGQSERTRNLEDAVAKLAEKSLSGHDAMLLDETESLLRMGSRALSRCSTTRRAPSPPMRWPTRPWRRSTTARSPGCARASPPNARRWPRVPAGQPGRRAAAAAPTCAANWPGCR